MNVITGILSNIRDFLFPLLSQDKYILKNLQASHIKQMQIAGATLVYFFNYKGIARSAILRFKYNHIKEYADVFGDLIAEYVAEHIADTQHWKQKNVKILYIPMHRFRRLYRGQDHMQILHQKTLDKLQHKYDIPVCDDIKLIRKKFTEIQHKLNKKERFKNMLDAFEAKGKIQNSDIVFIMDDIYTSGATATSSISAIRKKNGRCKIIFITIAKT